jgi:hypothetical protein
MAKATAKQIRKYYTDQGYQVRIDAEDHIFFRRTGREWQEGRWVSEYRVIDGQVVLQ